MAAEKMIADAGAQAGVQGLLRAGGGIEVSVRAVHVGE